MRQSCSLRKAKAETPQETPAAEASNWQHLTTAGGALVWGKKIHSKSNRKYLWGKISDALVCSGDRQIVTPFQFRSWVKVVALVSCRQLKLRPLQRPLFHALETSREKCRAFHVSCEWSMHEIWSLLNRFWSLSSSISCLQAKAEAPAAEAKGKPIRVTCWSSFQ